MTITLKRSHLALLAMALLAFVIAACGNPSNAAFERRNEALGGGAAAKTNFLEAQQINQIEVWKDKPHIIYWYWTNLQGELIASWTCNGVPTSWTESLEPNHGQAPYYPEKGSTNTTTIPFRYDIGEDRDVITDELPGKDGTFGDPVSGLSCMTVEGFPVFKALDSYMSPVPIGFPRREVTKDLATEALLLQANKMIEDGKCIDSAQLAEGQLVEIACPEGYDPIKAPPANTPANSVPGPAATSVPAQ